MEDFLKRLRTTGSIERAPSSGRPSMTLTAEHVEAEGGPGTEPGESTPDTPLHSTDLTRARNTSNISHAYHTQRPIETEGGRERR